MNFEETVQYFENTKSFNCKPGLDRMTKLLELLGNPHESLKFVHVAGTNGKGSTAAMLANILKQAGYTTGFFTSPHLYKITESVRINGEQITEADFIQYGTEVIDKVKAMEASGMEAPTQFERLTAMAFLYFKAKKADITVVEVGLGGRLDSTNVIDSMLSIITSISYDHMDFLGNTIESIASEKAGVIKKNSTVVLYPQIYKEAEAVVEEKCKKENAKLIKVQAQQGKLVEYDIMGQSFDYSYGGKEFRNLMIPLLGDHQIKNSIVAVTSAVELSKLGYNIGEEHIRAGLQTVEWPCRLSIVNKDPFIIIDGAHNEDGINALKAAITRYLAGKKLTLVIGMLRDKNYDYAVQQLTPLSCRIIATEPVSPRALKAEDMAKAIRQFNENVEIEADIVSAIEKVIKSAENDSVILICGSLYLAGIAYQYLTQTTASR